MISLQVKRSVKLQVDKSILLEAAQRTLEITGSSHQVDLSIVIGSDAFLRKLNLQYRQVDSPTDVLAFPADELDPDTADYYLGDVIISLPRAQEQASSAGHSLQDELQLLVVHGVLHLQGYDHSSPSDKKKMQSVQDKILKALGLALTDRL